MPKDGRAIACCFFSYRKRSLQHQLLFSVPIHLLPLSKLDSRAFVCLGCFNSTRHTQKARRRKAKSVSSDSHSFPSSQHFATMVQMCIYRSIHSVVPFRTALLIGWATAVRRTAALFSLLFYLQWQ